MNESTIRKQTRDNIKRATGMDSKLGDRIVWAPAAFSEEGYEQLRQVAKKHNMSIADFACKVLVENLYREIQ